MNKCVLLLDHLYDHLNNGYHVLEDDIFTPHAQHERGKVISVGVHYVCDPFCENVPKVY